MLFAFSLCRIVKTDRNANNGRSFDDFIGNLVPACRSCFARVDGRRAWAEQRRTGYPRLFPVRYNHSQNGCIDTEIMVRRLNFPGTLQTEDPDQYLALVETLGDPDDGGTRLWWDVESNGLD